MRRALLVQRVGGKEEEGEEGKGRREKKKREKGKEKEKEKEREREREQLERFAAAVGHARAATSGPSATVAGGFGEKRCTRKMRKGNKEMEWGLVLVSGQRDRQERSRDIGSLDGKRFRTI